MQRTLDDWLQHAEGLHPVGIDLGLDRVVEVAQRLGFTAPSRSPAPRAIIVAGTNGKGSTCFALERLMLAAGQRVGVTVSPHVHRFRERFRIGGRELDDVVLCKGFERIEAARGEITLSYFEFSALLALLAFRDAGVDVAVLEVGLGGRLDAFNLVSADTAVITSIGLDHQAFLGNDLESIGREKAGVLRPGQRAVLGAEVTGSVLQQAQSLGCAVQRYGGEFRASEHADHWDYVSASRVVRHIAFSSVAPHNGALAIAAAALPATVPDSAIRAALGGCRIPGRFEERRAGDVPVLVDVAHNPDAARFLRGLLDRRLCGRPLVALVGTLADKDAAGIAVALADRVSGWVCAPTFGDRGQSGADLATRLQQALLPGARVEAAADVRAALERALSWCESGGGILALGSFSLVEQVRALTDGVPADEAPQRESGR